MANQSIALQARAPQSDPLGGAIRNNAQMINMMMQQQAAQRQNAIAEQTMQIQRAKEARETAMAAPQLEKAQSEAGAARLELVTKAVGHALHTSVNNPTDETLDQAAATLAGIGLNPAEIEREIMPIKQLPLDQRKGALMRAILSDPNSKAAFEATLPKPKELNLGDRVVLVDENPLSPTFNQPIRSDMMGMTPQQQYEVAHPDLKPTTVEGIGLVGYNPRTNTYTTAAPGGGASSGGGIPAGRGSGGSSALTTNPGALKDGAFARAQPGYAGARGAFATFDTPEAGIAAQENLLRSAYVGKGHNTISKIVDRYAPQGAENSAASVSNYKQYIAQQTGIDINSPISAAQVPAVAKAMREFETGQRAGGAPAVSAPTQPMGTEEVAKRKAFENILPIIGYDPKTGKNRVSDLIDASSSGGAEMLGSEVAGFFGSTTPGRAALSELNAIAASMTFEKLRGKLGAQISDSDVRLVANTMADIANGYKTAGERSAAWNNVVLPILLRGAGVKGAAAVPGKTKNSALDKYRKGK